MRLLVHGGNSYNERQRIGEWPDSILPGALEDIYCLSKDSFAFGLGLHEGAAYLIARKLLSHENRPYAITILLDPGYEVWSLYEWNAAHLALSLFEGSDPPGNALITSPESINSGQKLEDLLHSVKKADFKRVEPIDRFRNALIGASLFDVPEPMAISSLETGITEHLTLEEATSHLYSIPLCFRPGKGWLLGGSKKHGKIFGAHMVVDHGAALEGDQSDESIIARWIEVGEKLLSADDVIAKSRFHDCWKRARELPIWQWEEEGLASAEELIPDLLLLGRILNASAMEDGRSNTAAVDEILKDAGEKLFRVGPLHKEIREATLGMLCAGTQMISPAWTRLILTYKMDAGERIDKETRKRLDPKTVIEQFVSRWRKQGLEDELLSYSIEIRAGVWKGLLTTEENTKSLFDKAVRDLDADEDKETAKDLVREIFHTALACTEKRELPLTQWLAYQNKEPLWKVVMEPALNDRSHLQAMQKPRNRHWAIGYIAFGKDEGGNKLYEYEVGAEGAHEIVDCLLKQSDPMLAKQMKDWIEKLVLSPFRKTVPIEVKLKLASENDDVWGNLHKVHSIYLTSGDNKSFKLSNKDDEFEYLLEDLKQLVEKHKSKPHLGPPDLAALERIFGGEHLEFFSQLQPKLKWSCYRYWLRPWKRINRHTYERELMRILLEHNEQISKDLSSDLKGKDLLGELGDKATELLIGLFYGGAEGDDIRRCRRFEEIYNLQSKDKHFIRATEEAFDLCLDDEAKQKVLARRFSKQQFPLKYLCKTLPKALEVKLRRWCEEYQEQLKTENIKKNKVLLVEGASQPENLLADIKTVQPSTERADNYMYALLSIASEESQEEDIVYELFSNRDVVANLQKFMSPEVLEDIEGIGKQQRLKTFQKRLREIFHEGGNERHYYREALTSLLAHKSGDDLFRKAVITELESCLHSQEQAREFSRRFAWQGAIFNRLFPLIPYQMHQEVLNNFYTHKRKNFFHVAKEVFERAEDRLADLTPYDLAVLNLLAGAAEVEREQIGTSNFGLNSEKITEVLDKILARYREDLKKNGESNESIAEVEGEADIEAARPSSTKTEDRRWYKGGLTRAVKSAIKIVTGIDPDDPEPRPDA